MSVLDNTTAEFINELMTLTADDSNSSDNLSCAEKEQMILEGFTHMEMRFVLVIILGGTVAVAGIIANSALLLVLAQRKLRQTNQIYFLILAIFDLGFQLNYIFLMCVIFVAEYYDIKELYYLWHHYAPHLYMLGQAWPVAQTYLILAASTDRYFTALSTTSYADEKASSLFQAGITPISTFSSWFRRSTRRLLCTQHHRYATIAIIVIGATALRVSSFWELTTEYTDECNGTLAYVSLPNTAFFENTDYKWFKFWILPILQCYFPFGALLLVNILIVYEFYRTVRIERVQKKRISLAANAHALETVVVVVNNDRADNTSTATTLTPLLRKPGAKASPLKIGLSDAQKRKTKPKRASKQHALAANNNVLVQARETDETERARRKDLRGATAAMVAIVSCYLIANTLNVIVSSLEQVYGQDYLNTNHSDFYMISADVSSILVILTCAIRLPIYYVWNRAIRKAIQRLWSCSPPTRTVTTGQNPPSLQERVSTESITKPVQEKSLTPYDSLTSLPEGSATWQSTQVTPRHANGGTLFDSHEEYERLATAPIAVSEIFL